MYVKRISQTALRRITFFLNRTTLTLGIFLFLLFYSITLFWNETSFPHFEPWTCNVTKERSSQTPCYSNDTKTILFYTTLFGRKPWPGFPTTRHYLSECPTKKCKITHDVYDIGKSDLVIFHARDMRHFVKAKEIQRIHQYRCPSQRMAFFNQESIVNDPDLKALLSLPEGFFNWTITFKRGSDFHLPYGSYVRLPLTKRKYPPKVINFAASKTEFVLWAVSNCRLIRDKYVNKLLKYIKVDIFGKCSGLYGQDNNCPLSSDCDKLFSTYKFYLAFENSICTDYITEKFWRTLRWNSVPITLTRDFYTSDVVPPGSFISVQDFSSVKALAEYLLYLDKNDTAYNEYFSWKKEFAYEQTENSDKLSRYVACDICDALHNECLRPKMYHDIFAAFWNEDVDCKEQELKLLKLIDKE